MCRRIYALIMGLFIVAVAGVSLAGQQPSTRFHAEPLHMNESVRASITSLSVVPAVDAANSSISGSDWARISVAESGLHGATTGYEAAGVLCVFLLVCIFEPNIFEIATGVGLIIGAGSAAISNEINEFRESLARALHSKSITLLDNESLAAEVYSQIYPFDYTSTRLIGDADPIPPDADKILLVNVGRVDIVVDEKHAALRLTAEAALRDAGTGATIRSNVYTYNDRDLLKAWSRNDHELVTRFFTYARHYLGQEIAADFLQRVDFRHVLRPVSSESVSGIGNTDWRGSATTANPTLAWELILLGSDPAGLPAKLVDKDSIEYDLQIFDGYHLVYSATRIAEPRHQVGNELAKCRSLTWSVRPRYNIGGKTRVGSWMRYHPDMNLGDGNFGRAASRGPAYVQGFPQLESWCGK